MSKIVRMRSGYTLVEVMVAVVILAIVLPGLAGMVIASRKSQVGSERFESAAAFGQSVMDSLLLLPKARIPASGSAVQVVNGTRYTIDWTRANDTYSASIITLTVKWRVGGTTRSSVLKGIMP